MLLLILTSFAPIRICTVQCPKHATTLIFALVPWPIIFLISASSDNHIFTRRSKPSPDKVQPFLTDFSNRINWRWHFKESLQRHHMLRVRSSRISQCDTMLPAEVTAWLSRFLRNISSVVRHSTHVREASTNM